MAGWQDDPIAGAAPVASVAPGTMGGDQAAPGATASAPEWASDPLAPEAPAAPPAPPRATESSMEDFHNHLAAMGYRPPAWYDAYEKNVGLPAHAFTDQVMRAATFGLADKAAAVMPAIGQSVSDAVKSVAAGDQHGYEPGMSFTGTPAETPTPTRSLADLIRGEPAPTAAAPATPSFADTYHAALAKERGYGEAYAQNHPGLFGASALATGLGTVASIPLTAGAGAAATPATLGARMVQGAKQGAAIGTMAGFGGSDDESFGKTAVDTGTGTVLGGGAGAALPLAAKYVVQPIWDWAARKLSTSAATTQAVQQLAERMKADTAGGGPTAQDMLDIMATAPDKPLTLADVGGSGLQSRIATAVQQSGPARENAAQFLNARDAGAGTRLAGDVDQGLTQSVPALMGHNGGPALDAFDAVKALSDSRNVASTPLYNAALAVKTPVDIAPVIDDLDREIADAKGGIQSTLQKARSYFMDSAGQPDTTVAGLHNTKLAIDDLINGAADSPLGRNAKRLLVGVQQNLVRELDDATTVNASGSAFGAGTNPGQSLYAAARAAYSGPSQSMDAVNAGLQILGKNKSPSMIKAEFNALSPGDQEFYKLGAANALKAQVAQTGMRGDDSQAIIKNNWVQQKLRPIFADESSFQKFIDAATAENRMFGTRAGMLGSQTPGSHIVADTGGHGGGGVMSNLATAGLAAMEGAHSAGALSGLRALLAFAKNQANPAVNAEMSRMAFSHTASAREQLIEALSKAGAQPSRLPMATIPIAAALGRAYPDITQIPYLNRSDAPSPDAIARQLMSGNP